MIKITSTGGPINTLYPSKHASEDSSFSELLAQQTARSRQHDERDEEGGDYLLETEADALQPQAEEEDAREELIKLLSMSTAERIRYMMLKDMGLTEESLEALPLGEQQRIEAKIEAEIKRQLGGDYDKTEAMRQV
ncbi:hypothetical protein ADIMK_2413 [Marinobacterium lacunae]|uniref:Uncharacterized protein n=1 Tax=Marinobacterium lacunae TaxID=1232683 RepID=A0A081FXX1_9GAMM|nr:hypothetical protein [Marinobacterium lacunae]KEA63376.1 hypothetical protein ADIMK_2413 [Marinobacterium lacunae]